MSISGAGVEGRGTATSGVNYGVYGSTYSDDGYAGYFYGKGYFSKEVNIGTSGTAALRVSGDEAIWYNGTYFSWGYGGSSNFFADAVGIGTNDPGAFMLAVNGPAAKSGGGSWSTLSDARLKDVQGSYEAGLAEVVQLNPVHYSYKADTEMELPAGQSYVGVVAQEVQQVIPEAVEENDDGYLMVNNDPIIWAMLNAIKELKAENDEMRQRLEALEAGAKQAQPVMAQEVQR